MPNPAWSHLFFVVLRVEPNALHMLTKFSATEIHPQPACLVRKVMASQMCGLHPFGESRCGGRAGGLRSGRGQRPGQKPQEDRQEVTVVSQDGRGGQMSQARGGSRVVISEAEQIR